MGLGKQISLVSHNMGLLFIDFLANVSREVIHKQIT